MRRRKVLISFLALVTTMLLVTSVASSASEWVYKWRLQPYLPESMSNVRKNIDRLIAMIEENKNGGFKLPNILQNP